MARRATASKVDSSNKAIAYVRVSTEEQATEGVSLEAQEAKIRAYCQLRGLELVEVVVDTGLSAGKPLVNREGGARVLDAAGRARVRHVIAIKLDRLFRDAADCLSVVAGWDKGGIALHLVDLGGQAVDTSTAMGKLFLTVMAGCAEMERNLIRERTAAAMAHKASKGEYTGGESPYGFQVAADGISLEPQPVEQAIIQIARELEDSGLSLRGIGAALEAQGQCPRSGGGWHPQSVKNLLSAA